MPEHIEIRNSSGKVIHRAVHSTELGWMFVGADLHDAVLENVVMQGAHFTAANLQRATCRRADFYWADFCDANLRAIDFSEADVRGADFTDADLRDAKLVCTNFGPDNLGGSTVLIGTDLRGAVVTEAIFQGATYDSRTQLPEGVSPVDLGMRYVEQ